MLTLVELDGKNAERWQIVNDGVMGGLSRSRISFDGSVATFEGEVSLANNGGFASVRTSIGRTDLSGWDGIDLQVEGRGGTFQLRLRTDDRWDGVAYRARFEAPDGEFGSVRIPFTAMEPTWRGRVLTDVPPLDPSRIEQLGFLIADGHEGAFRLRVERIEAYRETERDQAPR
jgi:monofunctional biosynthetic peptidoglycan transglycosylase